MIRWGPERGKGGGEGGGGKGGYLVVGPGRTAATMYPSSAPLRTGFENKVLSSGGPRVGRNQTPGNSLAPLTQNRLGSLSGSMPPYRDGVVGTGEHSRLPAWPFSPRRDTLCGRNRPNRQRRSRPHSVVHALWPRSPRIKSSRAGDSMNLAARRAGWIRRRRLARTHTPFAPQARPLAMGSRTLCPVVLYVRLSAYQNSYNMDLILSPRWATSDEQW